jgi:aspartyl aminopeptidase
MPVTVAERSKTRTVFSLADAETVGSNLTQGMDVECLNCVSVFLCLCAGRGLATS